MMGGRGPRFQTRQRIRIRRFCGVLREQQPEQMIEEEAVDTNSLSPRRAEQGVGVEPGTRKQDQQPRLARCELPNFGACSRIGHLRGNIASRFYRSHPFSRPLDGRFHRTPQKRKSYRAETTNGALYTKPQGPQAVIGRTQEDPRTEHQTHPSEEKT